MNFSPAQYHSKLFVKANLCLDLFEEGYMCTNDRIK